MATIDLPYVAWRGGRPRFVPGARERALGFKGRDLRHEDGRWYGLDEAHAWAVANRDAIAAQRLTGRRLRAPPAPAGRAVQDLWRAYSASDKFKVKAAATQKTYRAWLKPLEAEPLWIAPVAALDPIVLKALHTRIQAQRGLGMANGMMAVLSAMLSWGRLHGWLPRIGGQVAANPAARLDLEASPVRIRIGTDAEIRALLDAADATIVAGRPLAAIGDAVMIGFFSGQRERDVLAFVPGGPSSSRVELKQSKTGALVSIPYAPRLAERLAAARQRRAAAAWRVEAPTIVIDERSGRAYEQSTFQAHYRLARAAAAKTCPSVATLTFADLRDTAVTWYARAGCTVPEIASITGHSLASIYTILKHYLALDAHLADSAVAKLVDYMDREGLAV